MWIMLFFLIVGQSRRNDLQSLVPVFWTVLAVYPIWLFVTVRTLTTENAHAARIVVRASEEASALSEQGVGGYGLVYSVLLLMPGLLTLGWLRFREVTLPPPLRKVPRAAQALVILNIALGAFLVLTASYSIAVIALTAVVLSATILRRYSGARVLFAILLTLIVALFGSVLLEGVLTALQPFAEGTSFAIKIRDILYSLHVGEAVGSVEDRTERYLRSLDLFLGSPLIGVLSFDDLGKHSEILDSFAQWGVVIGSIFVYLLSFLPLNMIKQNKRYFRFCFGMLASVAIIFGLNNCFASAGLMLYIMFPVALHIHRSTDYLRRSRSPATSHA